MTILIQIDQLTKHFPVARGIFSHGTEVVHAVDDVNLSILQNENLTLVGESGCGKSTLVKLVLRLLLPTSGSIRFEDQDIYTLSEEQLFRLRSKMQMVFQDPFASLNPRKNIRQILRRPFELHTNWTGQKIDEEINNLLESVGLAPAAQFVERHPHELSGGQRQRIAFARAIALKPKFVAADEPVSSLDMSIRGQILNLMRDFQRRLGITYLFITHDLSVARSFADRIAVMYLGKIVELSTAEEIFTNPLHAYTQLLINATPVPSPKEMRGRTRINLSGEVPSPISPPTGCRFNTRCPFKKEACAKEEPALVEVIKDHYVACPLHKVT